MRLLILTQKVDQNDDVLGFFHGWIQEFSKHLEGVTVIALGVGEYHLPTNVQVLSLGKELQKRTDLKNLSPRSVLGEQFQKIKYIARFYRLIWRERANYDVVFVHMNPIYVVLGGLLWRALGKKVGLWYVHRAKTFTLWLAEKFTDVIFTSSKDSLTLVTSKNVYLGHGVDVGESARPLEYEEKRDNHAILCVGRLTPIKDQKTIIRACGILEQSGVDFSCTFIGGVAARGDGVYQHELYNLVALENLEKKVVFEGSIPHGQLAPFYWRSGVHVNACPTGGLDKVVIEAMLGGAIPVVANDSFRDTLGGYADRLMFRYGDAEDLARRVKDLLGSTDHEVLRATLEERARAMFDLSVLIKNITRWYETSR